VLGKIDRLEKVYLPADSHVFLVFLWRGPLVAKVYRAFSRSGRGEFKISPFWGSG
jgi:hypothetical protein